MTTFVTVDSSGDLPPDWDPMCSSYFQTREFLDHCQRYNPCSQRYHLLFDNGRFVCGCIVYTLKIDLLTFLRIRSPLTMQISGIPCSVSAPGIIGNSGYHRLLVDHMIRMERGFTVCLNWKDRIPIGTFAHGKTWPTIVLHPRAENWEAYVKSMRSEYRRRIRLIERFCHDMEFVTKSPDSFSEIHYRHYRNVHRRSKGKLETLPLDFFKFLPERFILTELYYKGTLAGWSLEHQFRETFSFFLGGQDYSIEPRMIYLAKLLHIIKSGIDKRCTEIELGQSAEVSKMRFGGRLNEKYMMAHHSNHAINALLKAGAGFLSYNRTFKCPSVFTGNKI